MITASSFDGQPLPSARQVEDRGPLRDVPRLPSTDEILATTAHELRLPLSHIKGFVTSLRRTDVTWDDETWQDFLADIELETDRLAELIDSLLAPRAPRGSSTPATDRAWTRPASVFRGALDRVRGLLGGRPLDIDLPTGLPSVWMDASQMERVLTNLIQNALKYSPPGSAIGLSARVTRDEVELSVLDDGPGIPAEDRERIFEPFFRTRASEQARVPGHGLGLAICRSIVLAHGGRIQVTERPGGGSRFSVFLPRVRAGEFDSDDQVEERGGDPAKRPRAGGRAAEA
jgi:two-component system sensor histidine kinase KdpD